MTWNDDEKRARADVLAGRGRAVGSSSEYRDAYNDAQRKAATGAIAGGLAANTAGLIAGAVNHFLSDEALAESDRAYRQYLEDEAERKRQAIRDRAAFDAEQKERKAKLARMTYGEAFRFRLGEFFTLVKYLGAVALFLWLVLHVDHLLHNGRWN